MSLGKRRQATAVVWIEDDALPLVWKFALEGLGFTSADELT